jgi:hypothetical protein
MPRIAPDQKQFYKGKIRALISIDHAISCRELQERLDAQDLRAVGVCLNLKMRA